MTGISGLSGSSYDYYIQNLFTKASSTTNDNAEVASNKTSQNLSTIGGSGFNQVSASGVSGSSSSSSGQASSDQDSDANTDLAAFSASTLQALFQSLTGSSNATSSDGGATLADAINGMDTDSDGIVTQEEFVAARPDDVTEEMATNLWNSFDTESAGELTTDELQTAMTSGFQPPPPMAASTSSTDENLAAMIEAMDTDGDGTITQEEFVAARPDDVTEEMATNLWNSFDTEGAGSLSTDELQTAMASGASSDGGGAGGVASDDDETSTYVSSLDTNEDGVVSLEEFMAAKPDDVSDEMALNLWNSFDTQGVGELSTEALTSAMSESQNGISLVDSTDSNSIASWLTSLTESSSTTTADSSTQSTALQALLSAIQSYENTAGYENTRMVMSELLNNMA